MDLVGGSRHWVYSLLDLDREIVLRESNARFMSVPGVILHQTRGVENVAFSPTIRLGKWRLSIILTTQPCLHRAILYVYLAKWEKRENYLGYSVKWSREWLVSLPKRRPMWRYECVIMPPD